MSHWTEGEKQCTEGLDGEWCEAWIPVSERLPQHSGWYHVWSDGWKPEPAFRRSTQSAYYESSAKFWQWTMGGKITHWMPLPKPPK